MGQGARDHSSNHRGTPAPLRNTLLRDAFKSNGRQETTTMYLDPMKNTRPRVKHAAAFLTALLVLGTAQTAARADSLDAALLEKAPRVMDYIRSHNYHNVGVLKFQVQKGN